MNNLAPQVFDMTDSNPAVTVSGDTITYEMEPETVSMLVIAKDKDSVPAADGQSAKEDASKKEDSKSDKKSSSSGKAAAFAGIGAAVLGGGYFLMRRKKQ